MQAEQQATEIRWSSIQAYGFAVICLVVGIAFGYLIHGPAKPASVPVGATQPNATQAVPEIPSSERMKHMGDKMAEPIMADLKKDPQNPQLLAKLGSIYFRAAQFSTSADYYEQAVKIKPTAEGYVSLSNAYHYAGKDNNAFENLDRALKLDPKSANALFNLGMLDLQVKNDPKAAVEAWRKLVKANPNHPRRAQIEDMIAKVKQRIDQPSLKDN